MRPLLLSLLAIAASACLADDRLQQTPETTSLEALLACNDSVIGGDALRAITRVEYDLRIEEPAFQVDGIYVAERSGVARIDIFAEGERVFSEGWDGTSGWQQRQDDEAPVATSAAGGAALRHGLEQPGHLWTLADMTGHGHSVEEDFSARVGADERSVRLTLSDGFEIWYWLDANTCLITRKRDFRAFHPDLDPAETWIETRYGDRERTGGVLRSRVTYSVDLATGDTVGRTEVLAVRATVGS